MMNSILDRWSTGWRGPVLAALVALVAGLPGVFTLPPLDRDESRFAQATAQMLETRDYVKINYQDQPRDKKPVGIHWLQSASVLAFSDGEARQIWAYRLPSLLGAMLAAAACAWGAAAFFGPRGGLIAGAVLGASFLLSTEASIAKTDAVLCGTTTLAMAALGRLYGASRGEGQAGRRTKLLFWIGLSVATLVKGPIGPMVVALTGLALWGIDRKAPWAGRLGWAWGLVIFAAIVGPWAVAITVATDGAFWGAAIGGDLAPKLTGGHESHGAPAGLHTLLAPFLTFPSGLMLPAALMVGWTRRKNAGVRFALCWLIPSWFVFEAMPTKLVHYTLPTYGALAWLVAAACQQPLGRVGRYGGAVLSILGGGLFATVCILALSKYGARGDLTAATLSACLFAAAGLSGAVLLIRRAPTAALAVAGGLGVAAHGVMAGMLVPGLEPLMLSTRTAQALDRTGLSPRSGLMPGPVTVAGYAEPSLVFALGTNTELADGQAAATALAHGRPAVVESRQQASFEAALAQGGIKVRPAGTVTGLNYSNGQDTTLRLYGPALEGTGQNSKPQEPQP
jgi:4-amino-4-deoxy-L-arabinose transferase-like glycosyltransferase